MVTGKIKFSASVDADGDSSVDIEISRLNLQTHSFFWVLPDTLVNFGAQLADFPNAVVDTVRFEVGSPEYEHYTYLLLEAFCYSQAGHTAIRVIAQNGEAEPYRQRVEFCIPAEAASINKLGNMLRRWVISERTSLEWEAWAG